MQTKIQTHTPGPWKVYDAHDERMTFGIDTDWKDKDNISVVLIGESNGQGLRNVADASLIAASPDLLAALKSAEDYIAVNVNYDVVHVLLGQMRAAIAKAEIREAK